MQGTCSRERLASRHHLAHVHATPPSDSKLHEGNQTGSGDNPHIGPEDQAGQRAARAAWRRANATGFVGGSSKFPAASCAGSRDGPSLWNGSTSVQGEGLEPSWPLPACGF